MKFAFLRKQNPGTDTQAKQVKLTQGGAAAYNALVEGLAKMKENEVDRVTLSFSPCEGSKNTTGRFIEESEMRYYPPELLDAAENDFVKQRQSYRAFSLVREKVFGIVEYPGEGVEEITRTYLKRLYLYGVGPDAPLRWVREGGVYVGDNLRAFAENLAKYKIEDIKRCIESGIEAHWERMREIMHNDKNVQFALEVLSGRKLTPMEQILGEMRGQIEGAGGKAD